MARRADPQVRMYAASVAALVTLRCRGAYPDFAKAATGNSPGVGQLAQGKSVSYTMIRHQACVQAGRGVQQMYGVCVIHTKLKPVQTLLQLMCTLTALTQLKVTSDG
jgi:hypothetical protein